MTPWAWDGWAGVGGGAMLTEMEQGRAARAQAVAGGGAGGAVRCRKIEGAEANESSDDSERAAGDSSRGAWVSGSGGTALLLRRTCDYVTRTVTI